MKDFLFSPDQARTPIGKLSGGERGRLMLARALAQPSNLMVLDEPTNDLDIETLDLLQELLGDYPGTILLVSHDRDFLDRVATSVIVSEGEGRWREYAGGYSDMVAQRGYGLSGPPAPEAPKPEKPAVREAARQPAKRKMSFKEKHALETLPGRIEALQGEIAALERRLDDRRTARARSRGLRARDEILCGQARRTRGRGGRLAGARNPARGNRGVAIPAASGRTAPSRRSRPDRPCRKAAPRR